MRAASTTRPSRSRIIHAPLVLAGASLCGMRIRLSRKHRLVANYLRKSFDPFDKEAFSGAAVEELEIRAPPLPIFAALDFGKSGTAKQIAQAGRRVHPMVPVLVEALRVLVNLF
jgi:hypothetical protein